jgi:phage I-like protein
MYTEDGKEVNLNEPEGARLGLLPLRNEPLNEPINELMNTELQAINAALGIETTSTLAQATAAIDAMKERIAAVELATKSAKIEAMLDKAVSEGKLHASQKEAYRKLALGDYAGVELALQGAVPYQPLAQRMNPAVGEKEAAWSWDDYQQHDKTGVKLAAMREQNPEAFQALYDAKFKH